MQQSRIVEIYLCPVCQASLRLAREGVYQCPSGHSFDQAREGYLNLLLVQQKHSREPGDSPAMLAARRNFLDRGHYLPMRRAVVSALQEQAPVRLLDLGTGEGYYAGGVKEALPAAEIYGIDISKTAVKMAARRFPNCHFAVAGSYALPFQSGCFSHLLNIFAPLEAFEAWRVLEPEGKLLRVSPGPQHLFGLKSLLYEVPLPHPHMPLELDGFQLIWQEMLETRFELASLAELIELIQMTPYAWKLQSEEHARLEQGLPLNLELNVRLSCYQKKHSVSEMAPPS